MKKNIVARILTALSGLLMLALAVGAVMEAFLRVPLTGQLALLLQSRHWLAILCLVAAIGLLVAMGLACLWMLVPPRPSRKQRGFVMQRSENGPIGISIKAIEGLVRSCVQQQEAVHEAHIAIHEGRDGIVIRMNIDQAAGVNIPLSVGAMQKQIKQYVTACTGVDVQEVRVLVENNAPALAPTPYTVQETAAVAAAAVVAQEAAPAPVEPVIELTPAEEPAPEAPVEPAPAAPSVPVVPVAAPVPPMMTAIPEIPEEQDDRPLHQRLFGTEDEPAIVPAPPELVVTHEEEATEEAEEAPAEPEAHEAAAEPDEIPEEPEESPEPEAENTEIEG